MHILISYIFVSFGKLSFINVFIHFTELYLSADTWTDIHLSLF